jgi:hypothetical protein
MRGISWIANWLLLKVSALYSQLGKVQDFDELREAFKEVVLKTVSESNVEMYVTKRKFPKAQKKSFTVTLTLYESFQPYISAFFRIHLRKTYYEQTKHGRQISLANV